MRQIVVTLAGLRVSQKATLMRLQRIVSPENLGNFQHAALPGLACAQLRRYMYTAMMIRLRQGHDIAVLFLDLSNGYGQTDRGLLKEQVQWTPELHRPLEQQMQQYQRLKVHVQTAAGRSAAYPVTSGVIQGGGMDPYFYEWNSKILKAGIDRSSAGTQMRLPDGRQICIRAQAVVDDTSLWGDALAQLQGEIENVMNVLRAMNAQCNPDKFGFLHLSGKRGAVKLCESSLQVGKHAVKAAGKSEYVKVLGANANPFSSSKADIVEVRNLSWHVKDRLQSHTPALPVLLTIIEGVLLLKWVYR